MNWKIPKNALKTFKNALITNECINIPAVVLYDVSILFYTNRKFVI